MELNVSGAQLTTEFCYLFNTEEELGLCNRLLKRLKNTDKRYPWKPKEIKGLAMFLIDNEGFHEEKEFKMSYKNAKGYDYPFELYEVPYKAGLKFFIDFEDLTDFNAQEVLITTRYEMKNRDPTNTRNDWVEGLYLFNLLAPNILMESMQPYAKHNLVFHDKDCVIELMGQKHFMKAGSIQMGYPDFDNTRERSTADILEDYARQKTKDPTIEQYIKQAGLTRRR